MIKVECVSCKSPYDVDERRIPDKGMKMRCPKCNTSFMVGRDGVTSAMPGAEKKNPTAPPPTAAAKSNANHETSPRIPAGISPAAPPASASAFGARPGGGTIAAAVAPPFPGTPIAPPIAAKQAPAAPASPKIAAPQPTAAAPIAPPPAKPIAPQPSTAGAFGSPAAAPRAAAPQAMAMGAFGAAAPPPKAAGSQPPASVPPPEVAAPSAFKKTLLGTAGAPNAQAKPQPTAASSIELQPKSAVDPGAMADLPAVKPAPKPAVPWGSLAPPSPDNKAQPVRPAPGGGGLPKGAMGQQPPQPLQAAMVSTLKSSSAGSAFGAGGGGGAAKQAFGHSRAKAPEPSPEPERRSEPAPIAPPVTLGALATKMNDAPVVDLPAAKPNPAAGSFGFTKPGAVKAAELPLIDLPAAKGGGRAKPANSVTREPASAPELELDFDADGGNDIEIDLPAPKPAIAAPFPAPAASKGAPEIDLPAPKPGAHVNKFEKTAAPKPNADLGLVDLPAPRAVDLPAPKAPGGRTMAGGFANAKVARGADGALLGDLDRPASKGVVDLPAPKGFADLPAARGGSEPSFGDPLAPSAPPLSGLADLPAPKGTVDLPAPKGIVDLPAPKGAVDLPAPKGIADLPAPRGIADLPTPKGVTDLPKLGGASFGELDLPMPKAASEDEASFGDLELPDLPVRAGFGNIELPAPRASGEVVPPKAATYQGVGPFGGSDESNFGDLDLGGPEASFADIRPDDLVALKEPTTSTPPALQEEGLEDFGEAGLLSDEGEEDMEFGIAGQGEADEDNLGLPPELLRRNKGEVEQAEEAARGKRALHVLIGVAAVLIVLGGAGAALGLTDYGYFGVYFLERYLPEAGDARFARDAIERAEKTAASDTYRDVQKSLALLGESRHKAGLNRELLTRSLTHEALFLVRFGPNPTSSAHVAAIMARLEERHGDAPGMELARAADAARKQAWADAERSLTVAHGQNPDDAYVGLLAGEVALRQGKLAEAEKAFSEALKHGGSARAQWGLARVALARTDAKAQRSAVEETLKFSPLHAEARLAEARLLWNAGEQDRALTELRQALGQEKIGDQFLWTSKAAKADGYSLLGFIEESRGHLSAARQAYEDALGSDPYLVEALLGAGRVLLRERRWNDALARFESALNLAQKSGGSIVLSGRRADVEARLGQGRAQLALNRAQDAKATLAQLLKDNPNDPEIVRAAGQTDDALGNKSSAEEMLTKAVELAPTTFASYLALAQHYFKENRADKASETLNEASTKVEENVEMRRMLGQSELARNRFDSAVHEFKRAVELDPQDLESQFGLGIGYRKTGQLAQAREIFEHIAQKDPQFAGLALERGELLEAEGKFEDAVTTYKAAREKDPSDAAVALRLGAAQVEAGKLDDADLTLQTVMRQLPNSAEAEYFTGRLALARGRGPDALTHFDRALALDNSQAIYHLYAARAALEMSNLGRTLEEAEGALERDGSLGDAYWIRGVVRMRSGAVKDALKDAKRALELNPSRYDAYALMAECYDELRQLADAANAYHMALEKDPQRGEWQYKLGRLNLDMGARGDAETALQKAMALGDKMDPMPYWLPDAYRLAGELARGQNNRKLAVTLFKRYLKIASDGALDRDDVRKLLKSWDVDLSQD